MFPSPSLVPPALEDFQWEYNNLLFGADTPFGVLKAEGFDMPEVRNGDVDWPRDHGQAMGIDLYSGKDIIFDLWVKSNGTSLQSSQLELAAASVVRPNEELPLWFKLPNLNVMCVMCRPRKRPFPIDADYAAAKVGKPELVLHQTDPRIYERGKESKLELGAVSGGKVTPTSVILTNGNTEMRPILIFSGPLLEPFIANLSIGGEPRLTFINPAEKAITIPASAQLLVDLGPVHRVEYYPKGIAEAAAHPPENKQGWVTAASTWWDLLPFANEIQFGSQDVTKTAGSVAIQWAPANEL